MGELLGIDPTVRAITLRTILVSGMATGLAVVLGVPIGYAIARRRFRGRTILLGFINTGMGMPPVVVGLVVWLGGNLERRTRVLTTAIVTETSRGEVERALGLGLVLLGLSFLVNLTLTVVQQRPRP